MTNYLPIIYVFATISAIAATVLAFIFILPEKKKDKLNKIGKLIHNICNFKSLILEKILQALYIFTTAFFILAGLFMLFGFSYNEYFGLRWYGGYGILMIIVGPIITRLAFELIMMFILLVKNVIQINNKLKSNAENAETEDIFAMPSIKVKKKEKASATTANEAAAVFCKDCGSKLEEGKCPNCQNG